MDAEDVLRSMLVGSPVLPSMDAAFSEESALLVAEALERIPSEEREALLAAVDAQVRFLEPFEPGEHTEAAERLSRMHDREPEPWELERAALNRRELERVHEAWMRSLMEEAPAAR